jgi:hypothetical protein
VEPGSARVQGLPAEPQRAWLQGTVLIVEFNDESAECDLVTAARIQIRGRPFPVFNHGWGVRRLVRPAN